MKTKLTLSVEEDLIQFAKQQARKDSKTISAMFSEFITHAQTRSKQLAVPSIDEMTGSLKKYTIDDSKEAIRQAYAKKHLR